MKRATIIDIAKALDVTPSTVSRALSGSLRVSAATRKRVENKAEELGYQQNVVAASLRKGKSDTIGMLVPSINRHYFSHVISAVEDVLNPAGYNLLICQSHERLVNEERALKVLLKNRVAGIIMSHSMETNNFDHLLKTVSENIPIVQFDRVSNLVGGPRIVNDNFSGAYMAVKHLIKSGYRKIAHFTGVLSVNVYNERFRGYQYALEEASLELNEQHLIEEAITRDTGFEKARLLLGSSEIDAIFCAGDYSAIGAVQAIQSLGMSVPNDIGVVGFANEPFAELLTPKLSSVEQNAYEVGHRTAKALINLLSQTLETINYEDVVPVRLLVRESSIPIGNRQSIDR